MDATVENPDGMTVPPKTLHFLGNLLTFRARSAQTGGSFSLTECLTAPGAGSPPHTQKDEEAFLVAEGQFEFMLDGKTRLCGPGDFVHVAPNTPHAFRNPGDRPARMLIINLPGGFHEGFFDAVGDVVDAATTSFPPMSPPDIAMIAAAASRYGIELLPPSA